jgi:hypothetical protein
MAAPLPQSWVITKLLEQVPSPNAGTPADSYFARWTYICTDGSGAYVCSSGSEDDCENQALTMAQSHTQQQVLF